MQGRRGIIYYYPEGRLIPRKASEALSRSGNIDGIYTSEPEEKRKKW
jgi:hypothetical protein